MSRIHVVNVHHGDLVIADTYAASDPTRGFVAVGVASEMRRPLPLVQDILAALGCRDDVAGAGRNVSRDLEHCVAWLAAHPVHDLALLDAQWLHPHLLATTIEICAAAGTDLWLVCQAPIEPAWEHTISGWPAATATTTDLRGRYPTKPRRTIHAAPVFPRVVDAPWVTFRATCREQLTPDDFAVVDSRFVAAVGAGLAAFSQQHLTEDDVLEHLQRRCDSTATYDEMIVETRACQVAAFRGGWLIQIDINQFSAVARTVPTRRQLDNPEWWARLAVYPEPWRAAACATAATGTGCTTLATLRVGHTTDDGDIIDPNGHALNVPAAGRIYIRAQRTLRILQGATGTDPLFTVDDERPVPDRRLAQALLDAQLECGLNLTGGRVARGDRTARSWASRLGVAVQPLEKGTRT